MIPINLEGRLALVTGGSSELGRCIVRTLAKAGADVAISYLSNEAKSQALVDELKAMGRRALAVKADITKEADVMAMRDAVEAALGRVDILVNNAVVQYPRKTILEQPLDDFKSQYETCVLHNVLMIKAFVPQMAKAGWGRVIAMNTESSMQCWPTQGAYVSGKRGQDGVIRTLAREVGEHGVTVNQVAPGWTISETRSGEGTPKWYLDGIALKRRGEAQEIANVVAFMASDLSSFITGAYIPVSGGNVMPSI